jgi:hypothetical protein
MIVPLWFLGNLRCRVFDLRFLWVIRRSAKSAEAGPIITYGDSIRSYALLMAFAPKCSIKASVK